jgi:DNA-binding protein Fis
VSERPRAYPRLDVSEPTCTTSVQRSDGGRKTRAVDVLGIDPSTLRCQLNQYERGGTTGTGV